MVPSLDQRDEGWFKIKSKGPDKSGGIQVTGCVIKRLQQETSRLLGRLISPTLRPDVDRLQKLLLRYKQSAADTTADVQQDTLPRAPQVGPQCEDLAGRYRPAQRPRSKADEDLEERYGSCLSRLIGRSVVMQCRMSCG